MDLVKASIIDCGFRAILVYEPKSWEATVLAREVSPLEAVGALLPMARRPEYMDKMPVQTMPTSTISEKMTFRANSSRD